MSTDTAEKTKTVTVRMSQTQVAYMDTNVSTDRTLPGGTIWTASRMQVPDTEEARSVVGSVVGGLAAHAREALDAKLTKDPKVRGGYLAIVGLERRMNKAGIETVAAPKVEEAPVRKSRRLTPKRTAELGKALTHLDGEVASEVKDRCQTQKQVTLTGEQQDAVEAALDEAGELPNWW